MLSAAQVALFGALSAHFVTAFSPVFSIPRQCETLRITWESIELPVVDMPLTEVFMSLIPLDNDPSRIAPEPYSLSVPSGGHEIVALPFPAGTQFFASAHILGSSGFERRTVSKVFTVEHSEVSHCLPAKAVNTDGRAKVKSFGKRQISVVGTGLVDATASVSAPANAIASPSGAPSGAPPAINVVGVTVVPAGGSSSLQASASTTSSSSVPSATGAVPPIRVIGTSEHPATGLPVPGNAAPAPSESGSAPYAPEASSSGYSDGAYAPGVTYVDSSAAYGTDYTETPAETAEVSMVTEWATVTVTMSAGNSLATDQPCEDSMPTSEHQTMHDTMMPPETITMTSAPTATQSAADTAVVSYTIFDDMVNAANSMFKAWNPYKPAYTPSTGN